MAAKINDGLFIGDFDTSQDVEFLELNKISSLINLAGQQLPNIFASHGIVYLTIDWEDREDFELFPPHSSVIKDLVVFIDKCQKHGTSVLLFSVRGTGRCAAAASCYLMYKYGWGFEKSYDFIFAKKPDLDLNRGFVEQLFKLDKEFRRQKYQSLQNISPLENERLSGWNVDYVTAALGSQPSPSALATATEEILMINSFNNSKLTITTLPGPYENAMRQFKNFKLQINLRRNQEAGVHLKRTNPLSPSYKPPRGGILKGGATHRPPHHRNSNGSPSKSPLNGMGRNNSNSRRVLEDSSDEEEYTTREKNKPQPQQEAKRGQRFVEDDSLMFGESISLLSAGKDDESLYDNNNRGLNPSDSSMGYYDRPFQPQESFQSQNSQGSDLYDFVGLQSSSKNSMGIMSMDSQDDNGVPSQPRRPNREAKKSKSGTQTTSGGFQDRRVRRSEAKQQPPSSRTMPQSRGSSSGATPEERLHTLLGDLQRGGSSKKNNSHNSSHPTSRDSGTSFESSSKQRADRGYRSEAKRSGTSQSDGRFGTTVHDVANMNIQPAYYRNDMSVSGQPVVAMPSSSAWREKTSSSERSRVQSERKQKAGKQYRSNTAGSTYRHGSPAPQMSAGGLSGRVKQQGREGGSGVGTGKSGSNQPLRRNGSDVDRERDRTQKPRYSTPTRSSSRQKEAPGPTTTSSRRHGTPTRERQPTPSRQRPVTPDRQRPATPERVRGWKY